MNLDEAKKFWSSESSELIINPRFDSEDQDQLTQLYIKSRDQVKGPHIWLSSSGTTRSKNDYKLFAISKDAFLVSAKSVNRHLKATSQDRWLQILPRFHVGGLSIEARAVCSNSKVYSLLDHKWNPNDFCNFIEKCDVTLSSLVPTQLYDLVKLKLKSPQSLRAVIIGGAALSPQLYKEARSLGWPVLPSFGMTEACSQIATADLSTLNSIDNEMPAIQVLDHIQVKVDQDQLLWIKTQSLISGVATAHIQHQSDAIKKKFESDYSWHSITAGDWYQTEDQVVIETSQEKNTYLKVRGRSTQQVKIGGELVSLMKLGNLLEEVLLKLGVDIKSATLKAAKSERLGHHIVLVYTQDIEVAIVQKIQEMFNQKVLPFERIIEIESVLDIQRNDLGKVKLT